MPVPNAGYSQGPSCFDRMKAGFCIGVCVGVGAGVILGGFTALRYGQRGRSLVETMGKMMLQSGGSFGTFMAIGTLIRC